MYLLLRADQRLKQNHKDALLPAHPPRTLPRLSQKIIRQSLTQCKKQLSTLLRHGHLPREDDGAIEFWRLNENLRNDLVQSQHWSDEKWEEYNGKRRRK